MLEVELKGNRIVLSDLLLKILEQYYQRGRKDKEAGGILLGQVTEKGVFILKASVPCSADKASRTGFVRNKKKAQNIIDYEHVNSGGQTIYLGEWHTHPEPFPSPSPVDLRMITDQYEKNHLNENFLILLITGTKGIYIGLISNGKLKGKLIYE
jgi:integrative and conjugative element protein (TIGR02256 family)